MSPPASLPPLDIVIFTHQGPKDFFPEEGLDLDLRPTKACTDAILVLKEHCGMLKGSTDKQILEVFNSEVGIRLHGLVSRSLFSNLTLTPLCSYQKKKDSIKASKKTNSINRRRIPTNLRPKRIPFIHNIIKTTSSYSLFQQFKTSWRNLHR